MSQWDRYCAVKPAPAVPTLDYIFTPPQPRPLRLCELGDAAWKDGGSLQWNLAIHQPVRLESYEKKAVIGRVEGIFLQDRPLATLHPNNKLDTDQGATVDAAQGVQWWKQGTPVYCKLVNTGSTAVNIDAGSTIARQTTLKCTNEERF